MNLITEYYRQKWDQIHTRAANSITPEQKAEYNTWIRQESATLYCAVCKQHAIQYIQNYPPENTDDKFMWSYTFHNNVNTRLNKPIMDYQSASARYMGWKV